jgi:D-3-phosphoglycerate dehydrogenase / 2-oxoglutarate reductase
VIAEPGHVVLTDRAWPDASIEQEVCARHGWELVDAEGAERSELLRLVQSAVGVLTNWVSVDRQLIEAAPGLRVICRLGVGVDNIDLRAAADRGVTVSRVPDYCLEEIADHVAALTLSWARSLRFYDNHAHAGRWLPGARQQRRVSRLTVGVWGAGASGRQVASRFSALGCAVLVDDRHGPTDLPDVRAVPVDALLASSDVLSLHLPLTDQTRGIVDARSLAALPDGALVVNTSRGGVLDLAALRGELESGRLAAALDVLPDEPSIPSWMLGLENLLITPHVAFSSRESVADVRRRATEDLVAVLAGEPPAHPVSVPVPAVRLERL